MATQKQQSFYRNYSPLVTGPQKAETHNAVCHHPSSSWLSFNSFNKVVQRNNIPHPRLSWAVYRQSQRKTCLSWICYFMSKTGSSVPFYCTFWVLKGCPNSSKLSWSKVFDVKKPRSFAMVCWTRKEENCLYSAVLASPGQLWAKEAGREKDE